MKTKNSFIQTALLLFAFVLTTSLVVAQDDTCPDNLLVNGNFNSSTCATVSATCSPNWSAAGGSPQIFGIPSAPYAWMWSTQGTGEAISGGFNFISGVTYDISFRIRATDGNVDCADTGITSIINVMASNSPGGVTASPNGETIFQSNSGPYLGGWSMVTVQFTPTVNASNIWIFPYQPASNCRIDLSIDDICITEANIVTDEGAFCCEESENLVNNGNFEAGNTGFSSGYTQDAATFPAQYDVTNDASLFGAAITDHSFCEDPTAYASNDSYLLVNGNTNQVAGNTSVIWEQTIQNLDPSKEYRFCGNFKNMPQCTFDVKPTITIETSNGYSVTATIDADPNDPCAWQLEGFCFQGEEGELKVTISLLDGVQGDGNDLAIDDLSVSELADPNLNITVQHQGLPQVITGSINTIATADDMLPYDTEICEEPYFWFVFAVDSYTGGSISINTTTETYGWGNDTGHSLFLPASSGATPWGLTTTYPSFPFAQDTLYLIGMQTRSCCVDCVDDGFTYQLTYNGHAAEQPGQGLSQADTDFIEAFLGTYGSNVDPTTIFTNGATGSTDGFSLFPNPANDSVTVSVTEENISTIDVLSISGQLIKTVAVDSQNRSQLIKTAALDSGFYMVRVLTENGKTHTKRLIIE